MLTEKNINTFCQDVQKNQGYLYTKTNQLSCKIANQRQSQIIKKLAGTLTGKNVIDVGCGDGTYTFEFLRFNPKSVLGIDPAQDAISMAQKQYHQFYPKLKFQTANIYHLDVLKKHFDIAIVRGVLHHLYQAQKAIQQLSKIADTVVILEPNGYNPILKIIEKLSPYHRQHEEKSYPPPLIDKWLLNNHGNIVERKYCGLVPFFCPDIFVKPLKTIEPIIEHTPLISQLLTAVYVTKCTF